jgi:hypothetical protein
MKLKYLCRYASLIIASLLLIVVGSRLPKEKEDRS